MHASCRTPKRTKRMFRHDDVWSFLLLSAAFESAASLCCVENTQRLNTSLWHPHRAVSASVGWFSQTQSWYCLISCERLSENLLIASLCTKINGGFIWFINDWIHLISQLSLGTWSVAFFRYQTFTYMRFLSCTELINNVMSSQGVMWWWDWGRNENVCVGKYQPFQQHRLTDTKAVGSYVSRWQIS